MCCFINKKGGGVPVYRFKKQLFLLLFVSVFSLGVSAQNTLSSDAATDIAADTLSDESNGCDGSGPQVGCGGNRSPDTAQADLTPRSSVGNPVSLVSGNKYQFEQDFVMSGSVLEFSRHYNSARVDVNSGFGRGWSATYGARLAAYGDTGFVITESTGRTHMFDIAEDGDKGIIYYRGSSITSGRVWAEGDYHYWSMPDGRKLTFFGAFLIHVDYPGHQSLSLYYRDERVAEVTDETGRLLKFEYSEGQIGISGYDVARFKELPGHLKRLTLPDGSTIEYDYDNNLNLTRTRYSDGSVKEFYYEDEAYPNHLTGLSDRAGNRYATWGYNDLGYAVSSEHADGIEKVTLSYEMPETHGEIGTTHVTNSEGVVSTYRWQQMSDNGESRLVSSMGSGCATCPPTGYKYTYDQLGRLLSSTKVANDNIDQVLGSVVYQYDQQGRLAEVRRTNMAGRDQLVERYEYNNTSLQPARIYRPSVNLNGERVTEIERDENNLPLKITERGWSPWIALPGETGHRSGSAAALDYIPIERVISFSYEQRKLIAIDGPRTDIDDITRLEWDDNNRLVGIKRPASPMMKLTSFDAAGRPNELVIGSASAYHITYDGRGNIAAINHRGNNISFEYDAEGRTISYSDAQGRVTRIDRDLAGRSIGIIDSFGRYIKTDWDSESRLKSQSQFGIDGSLLYSIENTFDTNGQLMHSDEQRVNAHGEASLISRSFERDESKQINGIFIPQTGVKLGLAIDESLNSLRFSLADKHVTTYHRDVLGQDAGLTDARGNTTRHIRNDFGNLVGHISQDTGTERFERDASGNTIKRVREDSGTTQYKYDGAGRVLSRHHDNGGVTRYSYNVVTGQLASIENNSSKERFTYNTEGDLLTHTRKLGAGLFETQYVYDPRGRLLSKQLPDGQKLIYNYYESGINIGSLQSIHRQRSFWREEALLSDIDLERRDGDMGWTSNNGLQTHIDLSPGDQVLHVETPGIQSIDYRYGANNKIIKKNVDGKEHTYQYLQGRLSNATSADSSFSYEYDQLGNRRARYVRDKASDSISGTEYRYAEKGSGNRLIESQDMVSGLTKQWMYLAGGMPHETGEFRYIYDAERRPLQVFRGGVKIASYAYNGFGERISKTLYPSKGAPTTSYFLYDNNVLSAEIKSSGEVSVQYIYLEGHRPVAQLSGDVVYSIHTDNLGIPTVMSNSEAKAVWAASYTPFGEATITLESAELNLRLPGQYADQETGTNYNYFRDYNPATGRYLTSDPIGLLGGENTYAYAMLNPLSNTDTFGLFSAGDSMSLDTMQALNGDPIAIHNWVENNLAGFDDRRDFYLWVHQTLNGSESERQANWFLAASQVNEGDALGTIDDFLPDLFNIVDEETVDYINHAGLGLAELNVQTFLSLYFGESLNGTDPVAPPGTCGVQLSGLELDLQLVAREQHELQALTEGYFVGDLASDRDVVEENLNGLLNYTGPSGLIAVTFGFVDEDTHTVIQHYWPDEDFDYTNVNDRITLGQALVRINAGEPWRGR